MNKAENIFVFVVCGAKEHIDTLHFSLTALKKFSKLRIIIVTDKSRNEEDIRHTEIVNVDTPSQLDHHQASIYLKTGLNKFLPKGNNYCYLDTDVVSVDSKVDDIFELYQSPITFCTDHCTIDEFSPSAISCGCKEAFLIDSQLPYYYHDDFQKNVLPELEYIDSCLDEIEGLVAKSKLSKIIYQWHKFKYSLPGGFYHLNGRYRMSKKLGLWYDKRGKLLKYEDTAKDDIRYVMSKTGFKYSSTRKEWYRADGSSLTKLSCGHLLEKIEEKFKINVNPHNWQHWNGGVFLFNDESHDFLNFWHDITMMIFNEIEWKTRDQGTLAVSVWHFSLQNHKTLPISYNLIADYNNDSLQYLGDLTFSIGDHNKKQITPYFIHVYHHWGDQDWALWKDIERKIRG